MLLTLDMGNTRVGAAVFSGSKPVKRCSFPTPGPESASPWTRLLAWWPGEHIDAVIVSSVVPRLEEGLARCLETERHLTPRFVTHRTPLEITLDVDDPAQVGADRIADVVGALDFAAPPCLVIDSGTALTVDVLDGRKRYRGGAIMPGVTLSIESLAARTARLEPVEFTVPAAPLGQNTADCIRAGVYFSHLGGLDFLIREYCREVGEEAVVIATGGAIPLFRDRLQRIDRHVPDLIHYGLRRIHHEWNRRTKEDRR